MSTLEDSTTFSRPVSLVLAIIPVVAAGVLGNLATIPNIPTWYASLVKPAFNPPNWIFGPVWTALYVLMAYAFYRILCQTPGHKWRRAAIVAFLVQIALNAAWSFAFFGAHSAALGLAVILPLWVAIAVTMWLFWLQDSVAGGCIAPYLAWVSFAVLLNVAIWRLNG
ncbi:MAG: TspO protein [Hyphomicrobiales bacterium]|nr:TspO protein [Hyphomicrobiales bacterium]